MFLIYRIKEQQIRNSHSKENENKLAFILNKSEDCRGENNFGIAATAAGSEIAVVLCIILPLVIAVVTCGRHDSTNRNQISAIGTLSVTAVSVIFTGGLRSVNESGIFVLTGRDVSSAAR